MTLESYDATAAKKDAYGRILVIGPPKSGKTTNVVLTSPGPVRVINCDGRTATIAAAREGAQFNAWDVLTSQQWREACRAAIREAADGRARTVVLDTITLLSKALLYDGEARGIGEKDKRQLFGWLLGEIMTGVRTLCDDLSCHLVIVAHMLIGESGPAGILPDVAGSSKHEVTQYVQDWVCYESKIVDGRKTSSFLVGPQDYWTHSCRSTSSVVRIPADVTRLLQELDIEP